MALPPWALPEHFEDLLPQQALRLEGFRRNLLDAFRVHGYQLVQPPMLEHLNSLVSGAGQDMAGSTFKLADQISGRSLGVRADITPQVTRIDAHLLNRSGVTRLCYCGSVVHTLPRSLTASREPIQIGAELYGHAGIEADEEVLRLLAKTLDLVGLHASRIDLGHIGLFRALARMANLDESDQERLFDILQAKDVPSLQEFVSDFPAVVRDALLALPGLYGNADMLVRAYRELPDVPDVRAALDELLHLAKRLNGLPITFDLADLRGYHYHTGLVFAAYCGGSPAAVALGGRYNESGQAFGRSRPATGFSLDLRAVLAVSECDSVEVSAILAPASADENLAVFVAELRAQGEVVTIELPGHAGTWTEAGCDRRIELQDGAWRVVPMQGE